MLWFDCLAQLHVLPQIQPPFSARSVKRRPLSLFSWQSIWLLRHQTRPMLAQFVISFLTLTLMVCLQPQPQLSQRLREPAPRLPPSLAPPLLRLHQSPVLVIRRPLDRHLKLAPQSLVALSRSRLSAKTCSPPLTALLKRLTTASTPLGLSVVTSFLLRLKSSKESSIAQPSLCCQRIAADRLRFQPLALRQARPRQLS
jgi:hypothetical protein